ncbi:MULTISPECIES: hypothetical protein [unclassified Mesorhizobium]|uniref:hypothetical protein n=1 Tax=unclassified Mesorhizobium TaxID=325217 RepID=UPI001FE180C0|nr:hypothetical protein [Mesorhizobium sp. M7A.F.Ca.US.011.01.1.1]
MTPRRDIDWIGVSSANSPEGKDLFRKAQLTSNLQLNWADGMQGAGPPSEQVVCNALLAPQGLWRWRITLRIIQIVWVGKEILLAQVRSQHIKLVLRFDVSQPLFGPFDQ